MKSKETVRGRHRQWKARKTWSSRKFWIEPGGLSHLRAWWARAYSLIFLMRNYQCMWHRISSGLEMKMCRVCTRSVQMLIYIRNLIIIIKPNNNNNNCRDGYISRSFSFIIHCTILSPFLVYSHRLWVLARANPLCISHLHPLKNIYTYI